MKELTLMIMNTNELSGSEINELIALKQQHWGIQMKLKGNG